MEGGDVMSAPDEPRRGQIIADFWIVCGLCEREVPLDARKRRIGINKARSWGWTSVLHKGWVCPECQGRDKGNPPLT